MTLIMKVVKGNKKSDYSIKEYLENFEEQIYYFVFKVHLRPFYVYRNHVSRFLSDVLLRKKKTEKN